MVFVPAIIPRKPPVAGAAAALISRRWDDDIDFNVSRDLLKFSFL
jgi:hypothetical protein